jgi:hypothetical protein
MFLSERKVRSCLWDPTNSFNKLLSCKKYAWEDVGQLLGRDSSEAKINGFAVVVIQA